MDQYKDVLLCDALPPSAGRKFSACAKSLHKVTIAAPSTLILGKRV